MRPIHYLHHSESSTDRFVFPLLRLGLGIACLWLVYAVLMGYLAFRSAF